MNKFEENLIKNLMSLVNSRVRISTAKRHLGIYHLIATKKVSPEFIEKVDLITENIRMRKHILGNQAIN